MPTLKIQKADGTFEFLQLAGEEFADIGNQVLDVKSQLAQTETQISQIITVNVKDYGAKGDGVTDDSSAILTAIEHLPKNGGTLLFPPGKYIQGDGTDKPIRFTFQSFKNIKVIGTGAIIEANPNNPTVPNCAGFYFLDCENLVIDGLTYDGRLDVRTPLGGDPSGVNAQHGIAVREGSRYVTIRNSKATRCMMDGFSLSAENVFLYNCVSTFNYRMGLTLGSGCDNILVEGGEFSYTGKLHGTSPRAGILSEPNSGRLVKNVKIHKARVEENEGMGISFNFRTQHAIAECCVVRNNWSNGIFSAATECLNNKAINNLLENNNRSQNSSNSEIRFVCPEGEVIGNTIFTDSDRAISCLGVNSIVDKNKVFNTRLDVSMGGGRLVITGENIVVSNNTLVNCGIPATTVDTTAFVFTGEFGKIHNNYMINTLPLDVEILAGRHFRGMRVLGSNVEVIGNHVQGYSLHSGRMISTNLSGNSLVRNNIDFGNLRDGLGHRTNDTSNLPNNPPILHKGKATFFATKMPDALTWERGDICFNETPSELGITGSRYIIDHWKCVTAGTPGVWVECRTLTGN